MQRRTIRVDPDTYDRLASYSADNGVTIGEAAATLLARESKGNAKTKGRELDVVKSLRQDVDANRRDLNALALGVGHHLDQHEKGKIDPQATREAITNARQAGRPFRGDLDRAMGELFGTTKDGE